MWFSSKPPAAPWWLRLAPQTVPSVCHRYAAYFWWLYGSVNWYNSEKTDNVKTNEGIQRSKVYRFQQLTRSPILALSCWVNARSVALDLCPHPWPIPYLWDIPCYLLVNRHRTQHNSPLC
jgi:hypothetical protein